MFLNVAAEISVYNTTLFRLDIPSQVAYSTIRFDIGPVVEAPSKVSLISPSIVTVARSSKQARRR